MLNKTEFVRYMAENTGKTISSCKESLDMVLEHFTKAVVEGHDVLLSGFGKIEIVERKGRTGELKGKTWTSQDMRVAKFRLTDPALKNL